MSATPMTNIAIVGCGFVADYYIHTLQLHPELELIGVADRSDSRLQEFANHHSVTPYASFDDLLNDDRVDVVVNLTNPTSHYEITKAALPSATKSRIS